MATNSAANSPLLPVIATRVPGYDAKLRQISTPSRAASSEERTDPRRSRPGVTVMLGGGGAAVRWPVDASSVVGGVGEAATPSPGYREAKVQADTLAAQRKEMRTRACWAGIGLDIYGRLAAWLSGGRRSGTCRAGHARYCGASHWAEHADCPVELVLGAIHSLAQPLARKETDTAYRNAQDCSPCQINHSDEHWPVLHSSKIGQIIGCVCDEPKQSRAQDGCL